MAIDKERLKRLEEKAEQIRKDMVVTTSHIGYSHMGGGFSMADMTVALYYDLMNWDPSNLDDPMRDRFILSKGHCGHVLYNILVDKGVYTKEELWNGYNKVGSKFGMHPNKYYIRGIEASTGSLGHGLALSVGYALTGRMDKKNYWVICMTGDGEMQEGSNWEAIMAAAHYELGNLILVVDRNQYQVSGAADKIMSLGALDKKLEAFGWDVINIEDGNDMAQILEAIDKLPKPDATTRRKPIAIVSNTMKGIGMIPSLVGGSCHIAKIPTEEVKQMTFQSIEALRKERN